MLGLLNLMFEPCMFVHLIFGRREGELNKQKDCNVVYSLNTG